MHRSESKPKNSIEPNSTVAVTLPDYQRGSESSMVLDMVQEESKEPMIAVDRDLWAVESRGINQISQM